MKKIVFHLPQDRISDIVASANAAKRNSLTKEEIFRAELLLEETYLRLSKGMNAPNLSAVVTIKKRFGDISLEISARGEAANPIISQTEWIEDEADLASAIILKTHRHLLGYSRWNGENVVSIKIHEGGGKQILRMVAAMVLGVAFGLVMRMMVPAEVFLWIEANLSSLVTRAGHDGAASDILRDCLRHYEYVGDGGSRENWCAAHRPVGVTHVLRRVSRRRAGVLAFRRKSLPSCHIV